MPRELKFGKLTGKFSALTKSKDSIQSLSLWIICHKTSRNEITKEWLKAVHEADIQHRLTLFYLANDVLQNCKRRDATEFRLAFAQVLGDAMGYVKDEIKDEVLRLIHIWGERNVFNSSLLKSFQDQVNKDSGPNQESSDSLDVTEEMLKNFRPENLVTACRRSCQPHKRTFEKCDDKNIFSSKEIDELNILDIRLHWDMVKIFEKLNTTSKLLQKQLQETDEDITQGTSSVKMLEIGETFYASQYEDVRKVAQAYKIFGKKLNKVKDALKGKMETLESIIEISSSPDTSVVDDGSKSSFVEDKTPVTPSECTKKNEGISIDTHMSFFSQGMAFAAAINNETGSKLKEAEEIKSPTLQDNLQTAKPPVEYTAPKCKKSKVETPKVKQSAQVETKASPAIKSEGLDMECGPDLSPSLPKLKTETLGKRKHYKEETSLSEHEIEIVFEGEHQTKLSNVEDKTEEVNKKPTEQVSKNKNKTEEINKKPTEQISKNKNETEEINKKPTEQISKNKNKTEEINKKPIEQIAKNKNKTEEIKNESTKRISNDETTTEPKKIRPMTPTNLKTESLEVKPESKEVDLDPEIMTPKLSVETSRRSFKPIKLNLISSSKGNKKSDDDLPLRGWSAGETEGHQQKKLNLEILPETKEEGDNDLTVKVKSEEQERDEGVLIEAVEMKIENGKFTDLDQMSSSATEIKSEELIKILEANNLALKQESEDLNGGDKKSDTKLSENDNGDSDDTRRPEANENEKTKGDFLSTDKRTDDETLSEIFKEKEVFQEGDNKSNVESCNETSKSSPVLTSSSTSLSTKQCLLKSMKVLSLLLSKKSMTHSDSHGEKILSKKQQPAIFPLRALIPIYSHSLNAGKTKLQSTTMEENMLTTQKLLDDSRYTAKISKIDSNLEIMDMDLDSEDDS